MIEKLWGIMIEMDQGNDKMKYNSIHFTIPSAMYTAIQKYEFLKIKTK